MNYVFCLLVYFQKIFSGSREVILIMRRNKSNSERYCRGRIFTDLFLFDLSDRRGRFQVISEIMVVILFDF